MRLLGRFIVLFFVRSLEWRSEYCDCTERDRALDDRSVSGGISSELTLLQPTIVVRVPPSTIRLTGWSSTLRRKEFNNAIRRSGSRALLRGRKGGGRLTLGRMIAADADAAAITKE